MEKRIIGPRFFNIYLVVVTALAGAGLVASFVTIGMSVFTDRQMAWTRLI